MGKGPSETLTVSPRADRSSGELAYRRTVPAPVGASGPVGCGARG